MTTNTFRTSSAATPATGSGKSLWTQLRLVMTARRQRNALAKLDKSALMDLGLSQAEVDAELSRPLWDVPSNWRV
ncbi:MAG: DUF1127 domain-containing protein [Marinosulfonomonas sp.]